MRRLFFGLKKCGPAVKQVRRDFKELSTIARGSRPRSHTRRLSAVRALDLLSIYETVHIPWKGGRG